MAHVFKRNLRDLLAAVSLLAAAGPASAAEPSSQIDVYGHRARAVTAASWRPPPILHAAKSAADWQPFGPAGGEVRAVAHSPTAAGVVLAATQAGVYRSADGGAEWTRVEAMSGLIVHDVEFAGDGTAYAATILSTWKSTDGGISWNQLDLGLGTPAQTLEVAIDPNDANAVWLGLSDDFGAQPVTVMRSSDAGASWTAAAPPAGLTFSCYGIAIHPGDSDKVFAVFSGFPGGGSVWFSNDRGATWHDRTAGLPPNPMNDVDHDGSRVLVAGGHAFGGQFAGLFASSDDGLSWTPLHDGTWPTLAVNDVELDPGDPGTLLAATYAGGVHKSTDGGATWQLGVGGSGQLTVFSARFAPGDSDVVLIGTSALGVYRSIDGGASFQASTDGIHLLDVNSLAANPADGEELAAAFQGENDGGVFTSTDGGASWTQEPVPPTRYITVRFAPDGTLYAISDGPSTLAPEGLYRRNAGGTWTGLGPDQGPFFESGLKALRFSINDPDLILTGGEDFGVAGFEPTVWRSLDAGETWAKVYEGFGLQSAVTDLEIVEDGTDNVAVASYLSFSGSLGGALRSSDGGASWLPSNAGLPADVEGSSLCASASDAETLYLANRSFGSGGLHRSSDGGQSWHTTGFFSFLDQVVCDPALANVLYVAPVFTQDRALRSVDHGATFEPFDDGLEDAGAIRRLEIAPAGPQRRLLMATHRGGFMTAFSVCVADATTLCLPASGRFRVSMTFETVQGGGRAGDGRAVALDALGLDQGGMFYFIDSQNPEVLIKVLDGCAINGHYWVFYAATTNVGFELTVTDTVTDTTQVYVNPDLTVAPATTDTVAFATCP